MHVLFRQLANKRIINTHGLKPTKGYFQLIKQELGDFNKTVNGFVLNVILTLENLAENVFRDNPFLKRYDDRYFNFLTEQE